VSTWVGTVHVSLSGAVLVLWGENKELCQFPFPSIEYYRLSILDEDTVSEVSSASKVYPMAPPTGSSNLQVSSLNTRRELGMNEDDAAMVQEFVAMITAETSHDLPTTSQLVAEAEGWTP